MREKFFVTCTKVSVSALVTLFVFVPIQEISAQTCVQPPGGLVNWWPGDGNANDIAGGNNGTLVNGATFTAGFVRSGNGQALSLDGADDVISVPDDPTLDNTGEISIAFGVSINQPLGQTGDLFTDHQYLVDKREAFGNAPGYTFCFDCAVSGEISFGFGDGSSGNYITSSGLRITPGIFYFFVGIASRSNDFVRIYQNGVLIANGSWGGVGAVTNDSPLFIGRPNGCCLPPWEFSMGS